MTEFNSEQKTRKFEIERYKRPKDIKELLRDYVPFAGAPQRHPYDREKAILIPDPFSTNTFYYEFETEDISYVEELPNLVNPAGESIPMARIWIKKGRVGMQCMPFIVEDTRRK